ncbi:5-formyltetrahydrofolate cyclo-ligase [Hippea maritima]|uniref:5-formyltetrahydrofolate cyclo-ligase n=1 Tax=Hippea maritima (strain ATCC 700847 / DSM 10411 / MH2) TaxID=760142 RepID=F2LTR4_HIPMA|nr:5-formyltetrahydrofolate cyclo-ligase [Hippea maritima]AEA34440.1 5-formyltetrahydrofolate cyclo-ligase [Hippea maritima DSM 10411]
MDKNELRNQLLKRRGALNKSYRLRKSAIISRKVFRFLKKGSVVASYCPFGSEANPNLLFDKSKLYFPKVDRLNKGYMRFFKGALKRGFGNIKEPFFNKRVALKRSIDAIIVPGIGFDERGYRIGYGGGFYDKFLKGIPALKVGVCFDCCIVDRIEEESHDITVDVVITERRKIQCKLRR